MKALLCVFFIFSFNSFATVEINPLATEMAKAILKGSVDVSAEIEKAIVSSGFGIKENESLPINMGQEIYFERWHVELLKLAQDKGIKIELDNYLLSWQFSGDGANGSIPAQAKLDPEFRSKFLEALKNVALNTDYDESGLNLMVGLVVALGREDQESPYDLLDPKVSGKVLLNPLQTAFLTQRIAAELMARALVIKRRSTSTKSVTFKPAVSKYACTMTEEQGMLMDVIAASSGALLGGVQFAGGILDRLEQMKFITDVGLEKYTKMVAVTNIAANFGKLLWTMGAFQSELTSTPNPLERTKTKTAGKTADLKARFWLDIGNAQMVNCIRPALNSVGLDFSLPQDGPLSKTRVEWQIHTKTNSENDVVETVGSDPLKQSTDENGISRIKIQGKAQKKNLTGKLVRVERMVSVHATTNLKPNNLKQDLIDISGGAGGVVALGSLPVEILNRIPFLFTARAKIKVIDWKEAEGDLFMVEGIYREKDQVESDRSIKNYEDRIIFGLEIKIIPNGTSIGTLTTFIDQDAKYDLKYESNISTGEGCSGTQAPVGKKDSFSYINESANVKVAYIPEISWPPGIPKPPGFPEQKEEAKITVMLEGTRQNLGWTYTTDYAQCQVTDLKSEVRKAPGIGISFSSLDFQDGNKEFYIDNRDEDGFGWVYKITREE